MRNCERIRATYVLTYEYQQNANSNLRQTCRHTDGQNTMNYSGIFFPIGGQLSNPYNRTYLGVFILDDRVAPANKCSDIFKEPGG